MNKNKRIKSKKKNEFKVRDVKVGQIVLIENAKNKYVGFVGFINTLCIDIGKSPNSVWSRKSIPKYKITKVTLLRDNDKDFDCVLFDVS